MKKDIMKKRGHKIIYFFGIFIIGLTTILTIISLQETQIYQQQAAGEGYWHTSGSQIVDSNNQPVRITGVNWFGLETESYAPHGLWSRGYKEMMDQIAANGYNTIRLPYSTQLFDAGSTPNGIDYAKNRDLEGLSGAEIMDKIVAYAGTKGIRIILDRHRPSSVEQSPLWYTSTYSETRWIDDWKTLALRYKNNPTVIGADLHNEPHAEACWGCGNNATDWKAAAQRAGNEILRINPGWLIFVEGIECESGSCYWWGGNLMGVKANPIQLDVPNKLVYSTHAYPPSLYAQEWFSDATYPENLPNVWDKYWGYIHKEGIAPVLVGEFGSKLETEADKQWMSKITQYMGTDVSGLNWTYWSWNPNSGDTGGILKDDWLTIDQTKQQYLKPIQFQLTNNPVQPTTAQPTSVEPTNYCIGSCPTTPPTTEPTASEPTQQPPTIAPTTTEPTQEVPTVEPTNVGISTAPPPTNPNPQPNPNQNWLQQFIQQLLEFLRQLFGGFWGRN